MNQRFPKFDAEASTIVQKVKDLVSLCDTQMEKMVLIQNPSWADYEEGTKYDEDLHELIFNLGHQTSVLNLPELEAKYDDVIPLLSEFTSKWSMDIRAFNFYKKLLEADLTETQKFLVTKFLKDFEISGLNLPEDKKEKLKGINLELSKLSDQFKKNAKKSTDDFKYHIEDVSYLSGVPENDVARFKATAESSKKEGYLVTLQMPDYIAIMKYCDNECVREVLFNAKMRVATEGETDNTEIVKNILDLRQQKADILGLNNYAEVSLASKMASSPNEVFELLNNLKSKALDKSNQEGKEIEDFAKEQFGRDKLELWDYTYYSEKLKIHKYNFDENLLKAYLPVSQCLDGLFTMVEELFGYKIDYVNDAHVYHEDVKLLELSKDGVPTSYIYIDLMAREGKRAGAWMDNPVNKTKNQLPVATATCNFSPATEDTPCLLTFDDFETLFHEFGHALHHTLTQIDIPDACGVNNVPWDAVEVPSTLMEFFCASDQILDKVAYHYETGKKLPQEIKDALFASKNFLFARGLMRQLEFSIIDMLLHTEKVDDIQATYNQLREELGFEAYPEGMSQLNAFGHIFSGGYAAGYYSYKWSDLFSADIFATFEENGVMCKETAKRYLDVYLSQGGSKEPNDLFMAFKGRELSPDAYLRLNGIAA